MLSNICPAKGAHWVRTLAFEPRPGLVSRSVYSTYMLPLSHRGTTTYNTYWYVEDTGPSVDKTMYARIYFDNILSITKSQIDIKEK